MTRTHRHRQSRQSAQSPAQRSDASLLSWEQLTERLQGAVSVEVEEPFVDLKLLVPRDALLVVHLDRLDLDFSTRHTDLRLKLALDTVAALCVVSERLRPDASRHTNFWQRVLTSEAAKNPAQLDDRNVLTFARFTRYKPMRVVFSWSGRKLPTAVIKSLQNFLNTPTAHHDAAATALQGSDLVSTLIASRGISPRPVKVGLRITDCSLDVKGLAVVRDGLRISGDSSPSPLLCDRTSLHVLDISGNELQVNSLHAVAQLIEDPTTRSLDGLFLKRAFPTDSTKVMVKGFAAGVGRMLKALLTRKPHTSTASLVEGVALSLAHNHFFDGVALRALAIALVKATRPLRSLSLAYTKHSANPDRPSDLSWFDQHVYCQDFIRVTMTSPVSSFTPDSVLDITMAKGLMLKAADTLFKHMATVVRDDIVPLVELAFLDGQSVHCTLRRNQVMSKPEELYWLGSIVPPGFEFEVLKVGDAGWLHVQYPDNCDGFPRDEYDYYDSDSDGEDDERDDGEEEQEEEEAWDEEEEGEPEPERKTGWAQLSMLATLRIGDDDILSMRFSGVVRNADVEEVYSPWARLESAHLPDLLAPWSHKLRALSLRAWRDQYVVLPQILFTCRNLLQLDLQGSRLNHEFSYRRWEQARVQTLRLRELQAVNLSGTDIPVTFIRARLKTKRPLALRYLSMRDVPFDGATLTQLLHFVQRHSCLEFAEFDKPAPAPTDTSAQEAKNRRELAISIQKELQSKLLETDALPLDRKIAFLSALASLRLGRPTALLDVLEKHIVPNIFDFAAGEVRSIAWCAPAAVKKWTPPST